MSKGGGVGKKFAGEAIAQGEWGGKSCAEVFAVFLHAPIFAAMIILGATQKQFFVSIRNQPLCHLRAIENLLQSPVKSSYSRTRREICHIRLWLAATHHMGLLRRLLMHS